MPLLGPLLAIRLLEQKCLKSVTECYQSFGRGNMAATTVSAVARPYKRHTDTTHLTSDDLLQSSSSTF